MKFLSLTACFCAISPLLFGCHGSTLKVHVDPHGSVSVGTGTTADFNCDRNTFDDDIVANGDDYEDGAWAEDVGEWGGNDAAPDYDGWAGTETEDAWESSTDDDYVGFSVDAALESYSGNEHPRETHHVVVRDRARRSKGRTSAGARIGRSIVRDVLNGLGRGKNRTRQRPRLITGTRKAFRIAKLKKIGKTPERLRRSKAQVQKRDPAKRGERKGRRKTRLDRLRKRPRAKR